MTVYFNPWPSTLAQKTVHYRPGPSTLAQMTVRFGSRPSTFGQTVHFRATVHFKDRPLSPLWTVHFGPDSFLGLQVLEIFSTLARFFENFRIFAKFELGNFGFGNGLKVKKDIHYEQLSLWMSFNIFLLFIACCYKMHLAEFIATTLIPTPLEVHSRDARYRCMFTSIDLSGLYNFISFEIQIWDQTLYFTDIFWLHRCRWRMLETKCVDDNFEMLVTVLVVFVTSILYLLT